jgi:hypothetical protein
MAGGSGGILIGVSHYLWYQMSRGKNTAKTNAVFLNAYCSALLHCNIVVAMMRRLFGNCIV